MSLFSLIQTLPVPALWALGLITAYLVGALPFGFWVVKLLTGQDVRDHGSGSTGTTNVKRVAGTKAALGVLALDFGKGLLVVILAKTVVPTLPWLHVAMAFMALIGHSKSVFLGFTGGKSAATGLATMVGLAPLVGLILAIFATVSFKLTRTVSIGSMLAGILAPVLLFIFNAPSPYVWYAVLAALYVIYLHRENIRRLLAGQENKLS